jgi:hypothetical protein
MAGGPSLTQYDYLTRPKTLTRSENRIQAAAQNVFHVLLSRHPARPVARL